MKALVVIDMQKDFMPGGKLSIPDGDKIIPKINKLMGQYDLVLFSKDWHPKDLDFEKWPEHCIQNTEGAEFAEGLDLSKIKKDFYIFKKGLDSHKDSYSIFNAPDFVNFINEKHINEMDFVGVAAEYCVLESIMDAVNFDIKTGIYKDAVKEVSIVDLNVYFDQLERNGIIIK